MSLLDPIKEPSPRPLVKPSLTTASYAPFVIGISGWGVALLLLVALASKGGCSLEWPSVVKAGPRGVTIIRESSEDTPAAGRLWTALRNPPHSDYLKEKGHTLLILDADAEDENGRPSPAVEVWKPVIVGVKMPALVIYDPASKKILDKRSIVPEDGADAIIGFLKAKGG